MMVDIVNPTILPHQSLGKLQQDSSVDSDSMGGSPSSGFLKPPPLEKQFLISPPASPPVGWEPQPEATPLLNLDLLAALSRLTPGVEGTYTLHDGAEGQPGIVLHVSDEGQGIGLFDGLRSGKIAQCPTPRPPAKTGETHQQAAWRHQCHRVIFSFLGKRRPRNQSLVISNNNDHNDVFHSRKGDTRTHETRLHFAWQIKNHRPIVTNSIQDYWINPSVNPWVNPKKTDSRRASLSHSERTRCKWVFYKNIPVEPKSWTVLRIKSRHKFQTKSRKSKWEDMRMSGVFCDASFFTIFSSSWFVSFLESSVLVMNQDDDDDDDALEKNDMGVESKGLYLRGCWEGSRVFFSTYSKTILQTLLMILSFC